MNAAKPLTRTQRRILGMLASNGGAGVVRTGFPRVSILGEPGSRRAQAPSATVTALCRAGLVRLGDGGLLALTDAGRMAVTIHRVRPLPATLAGEALAQASAAVLGARHQIAAIGEHGPMFCLELPAEIRGRLATIDQDLRDTWARLQAEIHPDARKEAA